jgi:hypothetical protein
MFNFPSSISFFVRSLPTVQGSHQTGASFYLKYRRLQYFLKGQTLGKKGTERGTGFIEGK